MVYCTGGVCGLILGVAYVAIIVLYVPIGAPPVHVDALLAYLAANSARWWWIVALSVLTDFLFVPLTISICFVLRSADRYLLWLAAGCIMLFVVLDLAVTWTGYVSLMSLSGDYCRAVTETQKAAILTAAAPGCALLHSKLLFVYNTLTLAVGILLSGLVMLRSTFGNGAAYLGIATGCAGIVSVCGSFFFTALSSAIILASCLTMLWVIVVGYRLCRIEIRARTAAGGAP